MKEKRRFWDWLVISGMWLIVIVLIFTGPIAANSFNDSSQQNFSLGTYANTSYGAGGIALDRNNISGEYISRIFDAGSNVAWNNISITRTLSSINSIFAVDANAAVYGSLTNGTNWNLKNASYTLNTPGGTQDMFSDGERLYIIKGSQREIWGSDNNGISWSLINNTFSNKDLYKGTASADVIYVFVGQGGGYKSANKGASWSAITDFNGVAANNPLGATTNSIGEIFVVDGVGKVFSSNDGGTTWISVNNGYGRTADTQALFSDSRDNLYIITQTNKEVWKSSNSGANWSVVNSSFSGGMGLFGGVGDNNGNIYVIAGQGTGAVFRSMNNGTSWTEVNSSYNGGNGAVRGMASLILGTNLTFQVRNCSFIGCSDGVYRGADGTENSYYSGSFGIINKTGRYFQYKFFFSTESGGTTPYLNGVSVDYNLLNRNPVINVILPFEGGVYIYGEDVFLNFSANDSDGNLANCWYSLNNGINKTLENCLNARLGILGAGNYSLRVYANDSLGAQNSSNVNFVINKTNGDIKLYLNGVEGDLTVDYPQQYNITARTLYGNISVYRDGSDMTLDNGKNVTPERIARQYNITAVSSGDQNHSSLSITRRLNMTLDTDPPILQIISPQSGASFGYNASLLLEYSVFDEHSVNCWYNINNDANKTLENCLNATFNVSSDGIYTLDLYANDSLGNLVSRNVTFSVAVGSPSIVLNSPIDVYLNKSHVQFSYLPSDIDLEACELWGNFDRIFKLNQTDLNPVSGSANYFYLNLSDRDYLWNIRCNDLQNHSIFDGNKTFYVDATYPEIRVSEPNGRKTSRSAIPLVFSVNETNIDSCWFNVYRGVNLEGDNRTVNCSSGAESFNVTVDADFVLNFYVRDLAGNINASSISFNVDSANVGNNGGNNGNGPSGGGGIQNIKKEEIKEVRLSFSKIGTLTLKRGTSEKIELEVTNAGEGFVNNCKLKFAGSRGEWFSNEQSKGLGTGEKFSFGILINIPENAEPGEYKANIDAVCDEGEEETEFDFSVYRNAFESKILDYERAGGKLKVKYSLEEYAGENHRLTISYSLDDFDGITRYKGEEKAELKAGSSDERFFEFDLPKDSFGEFDFNIAINDGIIETKTEKKIFLPSERGVLSGLTISDIGKKKSSWIAVLVFVFAGIIVLGRAIYRNYKLKRAMSGHGFKKRKLIFLDFGR